MPKIDSYDVLVLKSGVAATNGSQIFKDYSDLSHTITVVGNTQHSTAQYKFAPAAIKFDGTGDSLTIPHHTGFDLGAGDFTIDWWEYPVANTTFTIVAKRVNSSSGGGFLAGYHGGGSALFYFSTNGSNWYTLAMGSAPLNTWTHFAVTRISTSTGLRVYRNGVSPGPNNGIFTIYNQASAPLTIGETGLFNGYIEELRISKVARWNANFTPPNEAYYRFLETSRLSPTALADLISSSRLSPTALADLISSPRFTNTALADLIAKYRTEQTSLYFQKTLNVTLPTFLGFSREIQTGSADVIEVSRLENTGLDELINITQSHEFQTGITFESRRLTNVGMTDLLGFTRLLETGLHEWAKIDTSHTTASSLGFESSRLSRVGLVDALTFSRMIVTEIQAYASLVASHPVGTGLSFEARHLTIIGLADQLIFSRLVPTDIVAFQPIESSHQVETTLGFESRRLTNVGMTDLLGFTRLLETGLHEWAKIDTSHTTASSLGFESSRLDTTATASKSAYNRLFDTKLVGYTTVEKGFNTVTFLAFSHNFLTSIGLANSLTFSRLTSTEIEPYTSLVASHPVATGLSFEARRSTTIGLSELLTFSRSVATELSNAKFSANHVTTTGLPFQHSKITNTSVVENQIFSRFFTTEIEQYSKLLTSHSVATGLSFESRRPATVGIAQQIITEHQIYTALERFTDFQADREVRTGLAFETGRFNQAGIADLIGKDFITYTALANQVEKSQTVVTELEQKLNIHHVFDFTAMVGTPEIQVVTNEIYLIHRGKRLEILSVSIKSDRDSYCYSGDAEIALEQDFAYLNENDEITLRLNGTDYAMIIDSLGIDRQGSSPKSGLKVELLSTTCQLAEPRSDRISKVWTASSARAICEEMAGQTITWDFLDWIIPEGTLAVTNATRIEVIKQVIQNRAMIQTRPDGTFHVQAWYPIPPAMWELSAPPAILTDTIILSHSRKYAYQKRWNAVQIGDTESAAESQCDIEEEFDDSGNGVLRLYPTPWRKEPFEIVHTGNNKVIVGSGKPVIETLCEQIEFKDGKASVAKPIYEMLGIEWLFANLAPIATQVDSKEITAATQVCYGYSVARVKYRYRYWEVPVSAPLNSTTQFLAL